MGGRGQSLQALLAARRESTSSRTTPSATPLAASLSASSAASKKMSFEDSSTRDVSSKSFQDFSSSSTSFRGQEKMSSGNEFGKEEKWKTSLDEILDHEFFMKPSTAQPPQSEATRRLSFQPPPPSSSSPPQNQQPISSLASVRQIHGGGTTTTLPSMHSSLPSHQEPADLSFPAPPLTKTWENDHSHEESETELPSGVDLIAHNETLQFLASVPSPTASASNSQWEYNKELNDASNLFPSSHDHSGMSHQNHSEGEDELPCSSLAVLGNESDLLKLLNGDSSVLGMASVDHLSAGEAGEVSFEGSHLTGKEGVDMVEVYSTVGFLRRECADLSKELELVRRTKDATIAELTSRLDAMTSQSTHVSQEISQLQNMVEAERSQKERMEQHYQKQLLQLEHELEGTRKQLMLRSNTERSNTDFQQEKKMMEDEIAHLRKELHRLSNEMDRVTQDCQRLTREKQEAHSELERLQATAQQTGREHALMISRGDEQLAILRQECDERATAATRAAAEIRTMERAIASGAAENQQLTLRLENSDREVNNLRSRVISAESEVTSLHSQIATLRQQLSHAMACQQAQTRGLVAPLPPPPQPPSHNRMSYTPPVHMDHYYPSSQQMEFNPPPHNPPPHNPPPSSHSHVQQQQHSRYSAPIGGHSGVDSYGGGSGSRYSYGRDSVSAASLLSGPSSQSSVGRHSLGGGEIPPPPVSGSSNSLASVLQQKGGMSKVNGTGGRGVGISPFATEQSSAVLMANFAASERELTSLMTEKTSLTTEVERIQQRGMKTLKERARAQQIEIRLDELDKLISSTRKSLAAKPA